ncbi:hypothetical protein [Hymenobacter nivis]|uniref:Uncharacterized protein n=1 Tax=Hymenobacter nivis TaxID=1850093 RepID=A0A502GYK7_9BACT|nr:hypothetical protein [Hymenobacter nivis]TPG66053.1 hypothetical protein EAH73_11835 [Hymenobacter nivis]
MIDYSKDPSAPPTPPDLSGLGRLWRKSWRWLMLAASLVALFFGQAALQKTADVAKGVTPERIQSVALLDSLHAIGDTTGVKLLLRADPTLGNAPIEMVEADHAAGGYLQVGAVLSRILAFVFYFVSFTIVLFAAQKRTHPGPTLWAETDYRAEFLALPPREKFEVYQNIRLHYTILGAAALLAAVLTQ